MRKSKTRKARGHVLVVDDDKDVLLTAELVLKESFETISCLINPSDLPNFISGTNIDVILLDMNFTRGATTGEEGFYWLKQIKKLSPTTQVIMSTAYGEIDLAVEAMKQGAAEFLVKPWNNEKLISTVNTCLQLSLSRQQVRHLQDTQQILSENLDSTFSDIIGESAEIQQVFDLVQKVADTEANVLILGENGTGKELVARAIHRKSGRVHNPMISVDLGAISDTLFESEMFGHKKGAFTDAREDRAGRFEAASGGTLFLDEIGNLSLPLQAKLLGVLESRLISRLGSDVALPIDIRLICATNMPQKEIANKERFRTDLLYRINTVEILLPPLRARKSDIPLLVEHYALQYASKYNKNKMQISKQNMAKLQDYRWPGNVRELQHTIERAIIVSDGNDLSIGSTLLPVATEELNGTEFNLAKLEQKAIELAIREYSSNLTRVAKALGLGRTTLYRKMEKYGISPQGN